MPLPELDTFFLIGVTRTWQLLGARQSGLLGWLSPLQDESANPGAARAAPETAQAPPPTSSGENPGRGRAQGD